MSNENLWYEALLKKDIQFEGQFIAAIKTTGIFCRPSCTAKKPKFENVEFFNSTKEAMIHGYRPCKICNPLDQLKETPPIIQELIQQLNNSPEKKLREGELRKMGIEPNSLRRWFVKNHGMTFHAYQRLLRINIAFKKIKDGQTISDTAMNSGYESLSGFQDSFKSIIGKTPSKLNEAQLIDLIRIDTPIGPMIACGNEQGICLLEFTDRKMLETEFKELSKRMKAKIIPGDNKCFALLKLELKQYFNGERKEFTVPLNLLGTAFQIEVWNELVKIPYGQTKSYQQQSNALAKPQAVRAVANANGMNKISIIIPCHRVIGSDGNLTGYGGGLWRKKYLLEHEQKHSGQPRLFE
jgi:AraC family transcriptional regulator of adaptative response/methylated-DNA-[protein]-cysteine methyltransferase